MGFTRERLAGVVGLVGDSRRAMSQAEGPKYRLGDRSLRACYPVGQHMRWEGSHPLFTRGNGWLKSTPKDQLPALAYPKELVDKGEHPEYFVVLTEVGVGWEKALRGQRRKGRPEAT